MAVLIEASLIPNAETLEAIEELERDQGKSFATVAELMADLHSDADELGAPDAHEDRRGLSR